MRVVFEKGVFATYRAWLMSWFVNDMYKITLYVFKKGGFATNRACMVNRQYRVQIFEVRDSNEKEDTKGGWISTLVWCLDANMLYV